MDLNKIPLPKAVASSQGRLPVRAPSERAVRVVRGRCVASVEESRPLVIRDAVGRVPVGRDDNHKTELDGFLAEHLWCFFSLAHGARRAEANRSHSGEGEHQAHDEQELSKPVHMLSTLLCISLALRHWERIAKPPYMH